MLVGSEAMEASRAVYYHTKGHPGTEALTETSRALGRRYERGPDGPAKGQAPARPSGQRRRVREAHRRVRGLGPRLPAVGPRPGGLGRTVAELGPRLRGLGSRVAELGPRRRALGRSLGGLGPSLRGSRAPSAARVGPRSQSRRRCSGTRPRCLETRRRSRGSLWRASGGLSLYRHPVPSPVTGCGSAAAHRAGRRRRSAGYAGQPAAR